MKDVMNYPGPRVEIVESPVPEPAEAQLRIKVVVSGCNPKDWKVPDLAAAYEGTEDFRWLEAKKGLNQGDDIAGIVDKVASGITEFKIGDRAAAFHEMQTSGGFYAEYGIASGNNTSSRVDSCRISTSAPQATATLDARYCTYSIPYLRNQQRSWCLAVKLAASSNIHPIIPVAGKGASYIETLIDRTEGDFIIDYRIGSDEVTKQIRKGLDGVDAEVRHGLDPGIGEVSAKILRAIVVPGGAINLVLPSDFDVSPAVKSITAVGAAHNQDHWGDSRDLAFVFCRYFGRGLQKGTFSGHPYEVRPGGLAGVEQALKDLKDGKASAVKYVFRIAETPGI